MLQYFVHVEQMSVNNQTSRRILRTTCKHVNKLDLQRKLLNDLTV